MRSNSAEGGDSSHNGPAPDGAIGESSADRSMSKPDGASMTDQLILDRLRALEEREKQIEEKRSRELPLWVKYSLTAAGAIILLLVGWWADGIKDDVMLMRQSMGAMQEKVDEASIKVAVVASEISQVSPRQVRQDLAERPTKSETAAIIAEALQKYAAPWDKDRPDWVQWRLEVDRKLQGMN